MGVHNRNKQYGFASVKPRDAEIVGNKFKINKKLLVILGLVVVLGLIGWGIFNFFKSDMDTKVKEGIVNVFKKDEATEDSNTSNVQNEEKGTITNTASIALANNFSTQQRVKLALLASPDLFDYKSQPKIGCDALVFATAEIERTPKILNETLELLFNDDFNYGFPPANFISSTQNDLKFDSAIIANGIAKVFLTGKMTITDKKCDEDRVIYQIQETAKQFKTVKSVEIFLNGEKIAL